MAFALAALRHQRLLDCRKYSRRGRRLPLYKWQITACFLAKKTSGAPVCVSSVALCLFPSVHFSPDSQRVKKKRSSSIEILNSRHEEKKASVPKALLILAQISIACKELLTSLKQAILIKARIINSDLRTTWALKVEKRFRSEAQQKVGGGRRKKDYSQSLSRSKQIAEVSGIFQRMPSSPCGSFWLRRSTFLLDWRLLVLYQTEAASMNHTSCPSSPLAQIVHFFCNVFAMTAKEQMVREKWRKTHFVFAHNLYMENIPFNAEELSLWWDLTQQPFGTKYGQTNIKWEIFNFKKNKKHYYMSTASISRENTSVPNEAPSHQKHVKFIIWWFHGKQCGWALVKQPDRRAAPQSCFTSFWLGATAAVTAPLECCCVLLWSSHLSQTPIQLQAGLRWGSALELKRNYGVSKDFCCSTHIKMRLVPVNKYCATIRCDTVILSRWKVIAWALGGLLWWTWAPFSFLFFT